MQHRTCVCGKTFLGVSSVCLYCSLVCKKVARAKSSERYRRKIGIPTRRKNFDSTTDYKRYWYETHKELTKNRSKIRAKSEEYKAWAKEYREKNRETIRSNNKRYEERNRESLKMRRQERMSNDKRFRLRYLLRLRLNNALSGRYKNGSAVKDLGCSVDEFVQHIESKFVKGMSWENRGAWHLDHIKPLSSFNLEDRNELLKACHFSNIQPLWAKDNLKKGSKLIPSS